MMMIHSTSLQSSKPNGQIYQSHQAVHKMHQPNGQHDASIYKNINTISNLVSNGYGGESGLAEEKISSQHLEKVRQQALDQMSISSSQTMSKSMTGTSTMTSSYLVTEKSNGKHSKSSRSNGTTDEMNHYDKIRLPHQGKDRVGGDMTYEEGAEDNEKIRVQILPQDDNWGENTTAVTGDLSDFNDDFTVDDFKSVDGRSMGRVDAYHNYIQEESLKKSPTNMFNWCFYNLKERTCCLFSFLICFSSFVTPILFILLPHLRLSNNQWQVNECGIECEGMLIGIAFKLFILLLGNWAIFCRAQRANMPRLYELKTLLLFVLFIMTFSYWLFYGVRIIETYAQDYYKILQFTVSYVDVLLLIYIIAVFVLELRHLKPEYVVKIVRSPDGIEQTYTLGNMSIQRAAIWILEQYYKDFKVYNPWIENAHRKRALMQSEQTRRRSSMKNPDGADKLHTINEKARMNGHINAIDRYYEEYDYERRLRKRRARLEAATEEAFGHIRRAFAENMEQVDSKLAIMDSFEAAQAVFTSIARDLRRYLRITRQQPYFTRESIVAHLANCISYGMSPKSFLERYLNGEPLMFNDKALLTQNQAVNANKMIVSNGGANGINFHLNMKINEQEWILISDTNLYQGVENNLMFVLKQNDVTLMCTFKKLPKFKLIEDILDMKRNKFILKLNSETAV